MQKWEDYFQIVEIDSSGPDKYVFECKYQLVVKNTGQILATYNDFAYARKQARYKFKKILRRVEKILLG